MGAQTDALTAVQTVLTAAGIATVIKEFSTATPPTGEHVILTVSPTPMDRVDVDNFLGGVVVTADWRKPCPAADGETEYLAALDAFDALCVALTGLDRTCESIDPQDGMVRTEESADLGAYEGTVVCTFKRQEAPAP